MRLFLLPLFSAGCLLAQPALTPSIVNVGPVHAGDVVTINISLSGSSGQNYAGTQWTTSIPTGFSWTVTAGAASTAAGKQVTCGVTGALMTCVAVGQTLTVFADGVVAQMVATVPKSQAIGNLLINLSLPYGASATGSLVATTITPTLTLPIVASPCDLNSDGITDVKDFALMLNQVVGVTACTQDLDGDGKCTVNDILRIVVAMTGGACRTGQ